MKSIILFFAASICMGLCPLQAQYNLVPNSSFEIFDTCPDFADQLRFAPPWTNPIAYTTPDYFNACDTSIQHFAGVPHNFAGFQFAHTGVAYANIVTAAFPANPAAWNYREFIQVGLTDTLHAGVDYCLRFYVSAGDSFHYISNNMGMYFSPIEIYDTITGPLPYTPQFENPMNHDLNDRFGWTEISGTYSAMGGEKFIIIGNFHDTSSTVVTYTGWSNPGSNLYDYATYFIDDVLVTPCDSLTGIEENTIKSSINIYPNPFHNYLNIDLKDEVIKSIYICDVLGKIIYKEFNVQKRNDEIDLSNLEVGIYLLKIFTNRTESNFKILKN